jgi:hypothetical protein
MLTFLNWIVCRDVAAQLRLLEAAEFFNPQDYNPVFDQELEKLLDRLPDSEARRQAAEMKSFDWGSYIARSLARAGFRDDDQQEAFHQIVVKLLVSPGKLFTNWEPGRHGPLERRVRQSVWNGIRNIAEKSRNRRKAVALADPAVMAGQYAGRQPYSDLTDRFRQVVAEKLGTVALTILDARLSGEETKSLVGRPEIGTPSAFYVKKEVQAIKDLAQQFAARLGDPAFADMVARAMGREAATVEKRKQSTAARREAG